jgi:outer membrane autotransporter protein
LKRLSNEPGERAFRRVRTLAGALSLAALLASGNAAALDVTTKVVVDNPADLGSGDIIMEGGTLAFTISPTLEKSVAFFGATASTITAAPGQIVVFGPSSTFVPTVFGIGSGSTAVFGSATETGTIFIDTDFGASDPSGRVVVAGGTLAGGLGLSMMLAEAASTTVNAGATLNFGSSFGAVHNLKGSGRVITGAGGSVSLLVDDGSPSEFSGTISGAGGVAVMNASFFGINATMVLSGDNTYTGGTLICVCSTLQLGNGGTSGSIRGNVTNGGTLAFNRSDIYVFSGVIEDDFGDAGNVVQMGRGTTVLTGNNTYTGNTIVAAGKLVVDGSISGSQTSILNGGTLGGHGILGDTTVFSGGIHAPGNSIGTQTVAGNYVLASGAAFELEINGAGQGDKVVVSGTVDLTGAVLRVLAEPGSYTAGTSYIFIDNNGGSPIVGSFGRVTTNLAFLTPTLFNSGDDLGLRLDRNGVPFSRVARTGNQSGVATSVDQLGNNNPVKRAVLGQTVSGAQSAFDALSGEVHATLGGLLLDDSRFVREALLARLAQAFHAGDGAGAALGNGGPTTVASLGTGRMALGVGSDDAAARASASHSSLAFWTHGYGSWGDTDGDANASAAERQLGGFVSGMDAATGGSWRAGFATGYEQSNSSVDARLSSADVESYHLAAYAGGPWGAFALKSGVAWTWHDIDTSRTIAFPGFIGQAEADYGGDTGQIFGEAALPLGSGRMALEPFAGLAYVSVETDSFVETGTPGALRSSGNEESLTFSTLGFRAATTFHHGGLDITPRASVAWRHAFGDDTTPGIALSFVSGSSAFGINGLPIAENSALIEAGLDVSLGSNAALGISYSGQLADGAHDHGIKGSLLWQF